MPRGEARRARRLRGAVLLEVVVAVAILLMASITITGALEQGARVMERSRLALRACDLARSALAQIEAGIATPESLDGPVREAPAGASDGSGGFGESAPRETGWELDIGVAPAPFAGLSRVSVTAIKRRGETVEAEYSLVQLVRLSSREDDRAGEAGILTIEAERGAEESDRAGGPPGQEGRP